MVDHYVISIVDVFDVKIGLVILGCHSLIVYCEFVLVGPFFCDHPYLIDVNGFRIEKQSPANTHKDENP